MGYITHKNELDLGMIIKFFVQKYHLLQFFDRILQGCNLKEKISFNCKMCLYEMNLCKEIINFVSNLKCKHK